MGRTLGQVISINTLTRPSSTSSIYIVQLSTFTPDKQTLILTFICPCIASISLKYNQHDAMFYRSINFYKFLYMFQAVPAPIIRSTKLYVQCQVLSKQYCCLLGQAAILVWKYLTLYVQFCAPDDGWRKRLKNVKKFLEINRSIKLSIWLVVL
jgi:hypothetical protein